MLHRFRLLLIPVLATVFLVACGSETNNHASITDSNGQEVTTSSEENDTVASDSEEMIESEEAQPEETTVEELEVVEETEAVEETEETEETEQVKVEEPEMATNQSAETTAAEVAQPEDPDNVNPNLQKAVDQLLEDSDIDLENYVFFFTETDEYIEIEVRENIDGDATPLVGIYRYIIETDELLANDYLTGEFIPFENIQ